jgi:hypothetical protein
MQPICLSIISRFVDRQLIGIILTSMYCNMQQLLLIFCCCRKKGNYEVWIEQCWRDVLDIVWGLKGNVTELNRLVPTSAPILVCFVCCQQFIISRKEIHRRPLHIWKQLLYKLGESNQCHEGEPDYQVSTIEEALSYCLFRDIATREYSALLNVFVLFALGMY